MLVFLLALVAIGYAVNTLDATSIDNEKSKKTAQALIEAKLALIGYALTYDDTHPGEVFGYLPCPDTEANDVNGLGSQLDCGSEGVSALGRLPWKTLEVPPIKDGFGECLWYAISGNFKDNPKQLLNPNILGQFVVTTSDGDIYMASDVDPVVAVIFAPGVAMAGQNRAEVDEDVYCGGNYIAANYLDTINNISNADLIDLTFTLGDNSSFNDKLIFIKQSEVFENYCGKYSRKLLAKVDLGINDCNNSGVGSNECDALTSNLQYCSCNLAAATLIVQPCLGDLSGTDCEAAINDLEVCDA